MMRYILPLTVLIIALSAPIAIADDDLVRLPGQGEIKDGLLVHSAGTPDRLAPGGGLLMSFDQNSDGLINPDEINRGIDAAFIQADANEDGNLTPLEQLAWSESLPTRDDTLSNPARFDPNLDRTVSLEEFSIAIHHIVSVYDDDDTGSVTLTALKARSTPQEQTRREEKPNQNQPQQRRRGGLSSN